MAGQGPKARALAKEIADGLISLGAPAEGFETCLVSTSGTVLDDGEDVTSPRAATALKPLIALAYHHRYTTAPESVKALPSGEAWLASVERGGQNVRHLSVHRGHNLDVSNGHDSLVDVRAAKQMTFTGTREELRERLTQLEARGATGIIFGTSGYDVAGAEGLCGGCGVEVAEARRLLAYKGFPTADPGGASSTPGACDRFDTKCRRRKGETPRLSRAGVRRRYMTTRRSRSAVLACHPTWQEHCNHVLAQDGGRQCGNLDVAGVGA
jgi:hypothetical protein